jgi:cytosine/adenosine deaminase-related metal-dependent hydrolase
VLCDYGADFNLGDRERVTPLAHAISCRWASPQGEKDQAMAGDVFKLAMGTSKRAAALILLKAGADADLCAADGQSPLANAVHWENDEAFARLIAQGVDVTARDELGRTALDIAIKMGIGKPWARVYPQVLRDETDKQRGIR